MYGARRLAFLCAAVAALALILFVIKIIPSPTASGTEIVFREGEPGDISFISIQNAYGLFEVRSEEDGYTVHDIPARHVDYDRFVKLMGDLAAPRAKGVAAEKPADRSVYGLDTPRAEVAVQYKSGPDFKLYIGDVEPVGKSVYFSVQGNSAVYLMDAAVAANMTCAPKDFIDRRVTEELTFASPLDAVINAAFIGGGLERAISIVSVMHGGEEIRRAALSFGAATHLVHTGDDVLKLDQTYGIKMLGALTGIVAKDVEAYNCTSERLEAMGFGTPWMIADFSVIIDDGGSISNYTLFFLPADSGEYLVKLGGEDVVYRVERPDFMDIDPGRLTARWFLTPFIMDLRGVRVVAGDNCLNFKLSGKSNADRKVALDGVDFDMKKFRKLFRLLTGASNDGESLTAAYGGTEPIVSVEYEYSNGLKDNDIIEFRRGPPRRLAVSVNGKQVSYGMRDAYAKRVSEACAAILNGEDFDINW